MVRLLTESVNIGYGERLIVKDLSVSIPDKKITTIIGPNGCGKSTLLKAITRIISLQSGDVVLDGKSISKEQTKKLAKKMAILPQTPESAAGLTVGELVSYGRFPHQKGFGRLTKKDYEVIQWAHEVTGTADYKFRPVDSLSGGQRQRVWIAMALAQDTPVLFLDEPTTYLDIYYQLEILELVKRLNEAFAITIVMVLHDINQAIRYSDRIIVMKDGRIHMTGKPQEIITEQLMREVYGVEVSIRHEDDIGMHIVPTGIAQGMIEHG